MLNVVRFENEITDIRAQNTRQTQKKMRENYFETLNGTIEVVDDMNENDDDNQTPFIVIVIVYIYFFSIQFSFSSFTSIDVTVHCTFAQYSLPK